ARSTCGSGARAECLAPRTDSWPCPQVPPRERMRGDFARRVPLDERIRFGHAVQCFRIHRWEGPVAKFKVVTPTGPTYGAKTDYALELEALRPLGAEIVEVDAKSEDDFVAAAREADALYAKGRRITKKIIDGLERCRVISLGSVGVDSVDVAAATARGVPVTNVPDTFIEEVADHAMTLLLATFRRLTTMDRMVREGRWREGRPLLYRFPRLMGQTLGLVAFGHVARGVATRAKPFGLRVIAYDPFVEELTRSEVADHAMTLLLATFRRLTTMDRMVREGRWREGRPLLYRFPRLMGQTLGLVAFGHVARGVATRAKPFGLRVIAYDPFVEELT